jgi:hypothetical protein
LPDMSVTWTKVSLNEANCARVANERGQFKMRRV